MIGVHLIMGPMTTHEMRNDEEDDCVMLTTLIAVDEGSQLSKSGMFQPVAFDDTTLPQSFIHLSTLVYLPSFISYSKQ